MKIKAAYSLLLLTFISTFIFAQSQPPKEFEEAFTKLKLSVKYELKSFSKPPYLQSDFNSDGIKDIAILIMQKATKKQGILLMHGNSDQYFIFGAGTKFGTRSDNFKWLKGWSLYNKKAAYETIFNKDGDILGGKKISLLRPALYVRDLEDGKPTAGGLIYWTGKKYIWIHQGE